MKDILIKTLENFDVEYALYEDNTIEIFDYNMTLDLNVSDEEILMGIFMTLKGDM